MLRLTPAQLAELRRLAEAGTPHEICGLLIGRAEGDARAVVRLHPARNAWAEEEATRAGVLPDAEQEAGPSRAEWEAHGEERRFVIAPREILAAERAARAEGLAVIGNYHSHPDHPAVPSAFDRQMAWPEQSYVIVSVREGRAAEVRSWVVQDFEAPFEEEAVAVEG